MVPFRSLVSTVHNTWMLLTMTDICVSVFVKVVVVVVVVIVITQSNEYIRVKYQEMAILVIHYFTLS